MRGEEISFYITDNEVDRRNIQKKGYGQLTLDDLQTTVSPNCATLSRNNGASGTKDLDLRSISEREGDTIDFDTATFDNEDEFYGGDSQTQRQKTLRSSIRITPGMRIFASNFSQQSDADLSSRKLERLQILSTISDDRKKYSNMLNSYSKVFAVNNDTQNSSGRPSMILNPEGVLNSVSTFASNSNSRSLLGKYGNVLQREKTAAVSSNMNTSQYPMSFLKDEPMIMDNIQREARGKGLFSEKGKVIQPDPFKVSIHSYKYTLDNAIVEHISDHFQPHASKKEFSSSQLNDHSRNTALCEQDLISSFKEQELQKTLHSHHLAMSETDCSNKENNKPNNPVMRLGKIFGDPSLMQRELKKRSSSTFEPYANQSGIQKQIQQQSLIFEPTPFSIYKEKKNRYFDVFLPDKDKHMNNPLKILKNKLQQRDQEVLSSCSSTLMHIGCEIDKSVVLDFGNSQNNKSRAIAFIQKPN